MEDHLLKKVSILRTSFVFPSAPTAPQHLYLSSLDLFFRVIHYNKKVLFFPPPTDLDCPSLSSSLKRTLALALSCFFPLAGRLVRQQNGRFAVDCNDAGAELVEASIDVSLGALGKRLQMQPFFGQLAGCDDMAKSDRCDIPLLVVQITRFVDGGIALGISMTHVLADGHSLWHFLVSWGEIARGVPLSSPPFHDRALLKVDRPSRERARAPFEFVNSPDQIPSEPGLPPELVDKVFYLTDAQIKELKERSKGTSYEAICAQVWKSVAGAKATEEKVHLIVLANCRRRLNPQLPDSFGNAVYNVKLEARARDLAEETLAETAARVKTAVTECREEAIWDFIHWLASRQLLWRFQAIDGRPGCFQLPKVSCF